MPRCCRRALARMRSLRNSCSSISRTASSTSRSIGISYLTLRAPKGQNGGKFAAIHVDPPLISRTASSTSRSIGISYLTLRAPEGQNGGKFAAIHVDPPLRWRQLIRMCLTKGIQPLGRRRFDVDEPHAASGIVVSHEGGSGGRTSTATDVHHVSKLKPLGRPTKDLAHQPALDNSRLSRIRDTSPAIWAERDPSGLTTTTRGTPSTPAVSKCPGSSS